MKILLKKYKKLIIALIIPYVFVLMILILPQKSALLTPGGLNEVESFIEITDTSKIDNIYTVYVYDFYPITIFQSFITKKNDRFDQYLPSVYTTDTTFSEKNIMGKISKNSSINNALIYAYTEASSYKNDVNITYNYLGAQIYYRSKSIDNLKIGDVITKVDNKVLSYDDFLIYIKEHNRFILTINDEKEIVYEKNPNDIFTFYPLYEIINATPSYNIIETSTSGPSGGFMQALSIYIRLLDLDLKGMKIAGTGTIEINGNIGKIGGIKQKVYTAIDNKVDYFFMPVANLEDIDINNYPLNIIAFTTFKEAVEKINELFY